MSGAGVHGAQVVLLLLLLFVVIFAALARRLKTPYPIVLVIAGLVLGFIPGIPRVTLDPELILFVVLPPLLYSAAWEISWQDFSQTFPAVASLAIGLVAFTVFGVAEAAPWLFPGFDWRVGFVLGAVVAPTDAIAASAIAKRVGLPKRIVSVLDGESLVNDATGLLALEFGVGMLLSGQTPAIHLGVLRLVYLIVVGITIGLVLGWITERFEHRIDDATIEIAASLFVPYAAYLAADAARGSGVLAVVTSGIYLSRKSSRFFSANVRLQIFAVWGSLTFLLNGLVFVLIGLQLPYILAGIGNIAMRQLFLYGAAFSALLILLRLLWTYPSAYVAYYIRTRLLHHKGDMPGPRQLFVVGWTGMRGVVSLAAAMSLPLTLANSRPFPQRNLIVFLAFSVILVTLILQGLTLPRLIRRLGLTGGAGPPCDEDEARKIVLEAALDYLEKQRPAGPLANLYDDLTLHYRRRLARVSHNPDDENRTGSEHYARYLALSRALLDVERNTALRLRDEGRIQDDVLRHLEHELDLSETRLKLAMDPQRKQAT